MPDPAHLNNEFERALAGLTYVAFASLTDNDPEKAQVLLGIVHKYLLVRADIDLPPTDTQMARLVQEGRDYLATHDIPMW